MSLAATTATSSPIHAAVETPSPLTTVVPSIQLRKSEDGISYLQLHGPAVSAAAAASADVVAGTGSDLTLTVPAAGGGAPQQLKKRPYTSWSDEEAALFFEGIKVFGRDHQKLANHITTKTYEQVRHFYYRLVKKMNVLLEPLGKRLNKTDKNEVRDAILFWYEFFKPKGKLTAAPLPGSEDANKLAPALAEFLKSRSSAASSALNIPAPIQLQQQQQQQHSHHPKTLLPKSQTERLHSIIYEINSQQQHLHSSLLPHPPPAAAAIASINAEITTTARPSSPAPTPLPSSSSSSSQGAFAPCGGGGGGGEYRNPTTMAVNPRHQLTADETKERRSASPSVTAATTATSTETANAQAVRSDSKASTTCVPPVTTSGSSGSTTKGGPRSSRNQRAEHSSVPKRITLQLIPKETTVAEQIARAGYNPLLQLTFAAKKPISYIIHHMMKKWVHDANGQRVVPVATSPIRLYGVPPMDHYSWGIENEDVSSASIYHLLGCSGVMRLLYCWLEEEKENTRTTTTEQQQQQQQHQSTTTTITSRASSHNAATAPAVALLSPGTPKHTPKMLLSPAAAAAAAAGTNATGTAASVDGSEPEAIMTIMGPPVGSPFTKKEKEDSSVLYSIIPPFLSPIARSRSPSPMASSGGAGTSTLSSHHSPTSPSRFLALTPKRSPTATPGSATISATGALSSYGSGTGGSSGAANLLQPNASPKFKVPDTPNILSLSFLLDEASRDGFQPAENDEKECRDFYKEFDATSHDGEDSVGFSRFFRTANLLGSDEESSPIRRRLDFSSVPDSPGTIASTMTTGWAGTKRRLSDLMSTATTSSSPSHHQPQQSTLPIAAGGLIPGGGGGGGGARDYLGGGGGDDEDEDLSIMGHGGSGGTRASKRKKLSLGSSTVFGGGGAKEQQSSSSSASAAPAAPAALPTTSSVNISLDSLLDETNSNSCFGAFWAMAAETSNG